MVELGSVGILVRGVCVVLGAVLSNDVCGGARNSLNDNGGWAKKVLLGWCIEPFWNS